MRGLGISPQISSAWGAMHVEDWKKLFVFFFFLLFPHCFCPAPGWSHDIQAGCRRSSPWQTAEDSPFWRGLASSARSLKFFQARIDRQAQFNSSCNNNNRESSLCAADPRGEVENCPRNKRDSVRSK